MGNRIFGIYVAMMALSGHLDSSVPACAIADVPTAFRDMWTWADLRAGAEAMDPFDYFKFRYYEKWLSGIPIPRRQGIPARGRISLADKRTAWRSGQAGRRSARGTRSG